MVDRAQAVEFGACASGFGPADALRASELTPQYDTNRNGNLDLHEPINIQAEAAWKEFQRLVVNGNGKLDPDELKAACQAEQQECERRLKKSIEGRP